MGFNKVPGRKKKKAAGEKEETMFPCCKNRLQVGRGITRLQFNQLRPIVATGNFALFRGLRLVLTGIKFILI